MKNKKNKFGNKKTTIILGRVEHKFDSKAESDRGVLLYYLEKNGIISDLKFQEKFRLLDFKCSKKMFIGNLYIKQTKTTEKVDYIADFYYFDKEINKWVIEDVKSSETAKNKDYIIKRKLLLDSLRTDSFFKDIIFREIIDKRRIEWEI